MMQPFQTIWRSTISRSTVAGLLAILSLGTQACDSDEAVAVDPSEIAVRYEQRTSRLLVSFNRQLIEGEELYVHTGRGELGQLSCSVISQSTGAIDTSKPIPDMRHRTGPTYLAPQVDDALFEPFYGPEWAHAEPTPEMLASLERGTDALVSVCLLRDGVITGQFQTTLDDAQNRDRALGKADGDEYEDAPIETVTGYAEQCVAELGEIPFFEKLGEGDYSTFNCLESPRIPMTVTENGEVTHPDEEVDKCDKPQYIYTLCEPGPRVGRRVNEQGTHWVILCRKSLGGWSSKLYNDIAMVGHNPLTGKTCFFQNALYSKKDGGAIPHPADKEKSGNLWSGIQGGLGSGIRCTNCHDNDPFIHTPWIDQAKMENGAPVIPMMGVEEDFGLGYNEAPYSLVDQEGQNWTMHPHLVSPEAKACTKCHRIGQGRWLRWLNRLDAEDTIFARKTTDEYLKFEKLHWMPTDLEGLTEDNWAESEFGKALEFIKSCENEFGDNPNNACKWEPIPDGSELSEAASAPVELPDEELASEALKLIGADVEGAVKRCTECHAVTRAGIRQWNRDTAFALSRCFAEGTTPSQTLACMRSDETDSESPFAAVKMGLFAAGAHLHLFKELFRAAYPADAQGNDDTTWLRKYARFQRRVAMPKGNHPKLTQREFDIVMEWFKRDIPKLDETLPEAPPPERCEENLPTELTDHIEEMRLEGWSSLNEERGLRMYGCADGQAPLDCLQDRPRTDDWEDSKGWARFGTLRLLRDFGFKTYFWTRSSADGRFVGNGGGSGVGNALGVTGARAVITDLQRDVDIAVKASYDPGFFPDNSGFVFQGTRHGAGFCSQDLLMREPTFIDFNEPECAGVSGISLYQHIGAGLSGADYFVVNSQFVSDNGGHRPRLNGDPKALFGANATIKLTPMIYTGTQYEALEPVKLETPYEGDTVISPSSTLLAGRLTGPNSRQIGFVLRRIEASRTADGYIFRTPEVGRLCLRGAKASFSFDERYLTTHHYIDDDDAAELGFVGPEDTEFADFKTKGGANIYVADLLTGEKIRVTNMEPGQYALYPHFRSDGWLYFLVRDLNTKTEHLVASDAALRMGQ